jgi:hypothetical protein
MKSARRNPSKAGMRARLEVETVGAAMLGNVRIRLLDMLG